MVQQSKGSIDPRIWIQNLNFLKDAEYYSGAGSVDHRESITPTTNKGTLNFVKLQERLKQLEQEQKAQQDKELSAALNTGQELQDQNLLPEPDQTKPFLESLQKGEVLIKRYQHKDSSPSDVLRFGINTNDQDIKVILQRMSSEQDKKSVSIKSTTSNAEIIQKAQALSPTPQEKILLKGAIHYLNQFDHNNKCVLVDMFDRKGDIHTAVLMKQDVKTLVIDPSNPEYSIILKGIKNDLILCSDTNKTIYTRAKKPNSMDRIESGPKVENGRDCIDVAVKLAFALNKSKAELVVTDDKIDKTLLGLHDSIECITNITNVSKLFSSAVEKHPFRIKQSSDVSESKKASVLLKGFKKAEALCKKTVEELNLESEKDAIKQISDLHKHFICNNIAHTEYTNYINHHFRELSTILNNVPELKPLGERISNEFDYIDTHYGE